MLVELRHAMIQRRILRGELKLREKDDLEARRRTRKAGHANAAYDRAADKGAYGTVWSGHVVFVTDRKAAVVVLASIKGAAAVDGIAFGFTDIQ